MGPVYLDKKTFKNKGENRIKDLKITHDLQKDIKDAWTKFLKFL